MRGHRRLSAGGILETNVTLIAPGNCQRLIESNRENGVQVESAGGCLGNGIERFLLANFMLRIREKAGVVSENAAESLHGENFEHQKGETADQDAKQGNRSSF